MQRPQPVLLLRKAQGERVTQYAGLGLALWLGGGAQMTQEMLQEAQGQSHVELSGTAVPLSVRVKRL